MLTKSLSREDFWISLYIHFIRMELINVKENLITFQLLAVCISQLKGLDGCIEKLKTKFKLRDNDLND